MGVSKNGTYPWSFVT